MSDRICSIPFCTKPRRCAGYCGAHYARSLKGMRMDTPLRKSPTARIKTNKKYFYKWKDKRTKDEWYSIRSKAKRIGVPFDLPREGLEIPKVCPVLGIPLIRNFGGKRGQNSDYSPSIDRIIPELGYVPGNVHIISFRANRIKTNATPEELMKVAEYFKRIK